LPQVENWAGKGFQDEAQNNDSADLAFTRRLVSLSARLFLSARWYSF